MIVLMIFAKLENVLDLSLLLLIFSVMSSSEDSSDSESETTTESSESSETMSTSIEGGSYDGKVIKLIKKGQRKKKNGNVERMRPVDRERY